MKRIVDELWVTYRRNMDMFKVLLGINLLLLQLLLIGAKLIVLHQ
jgi:hypothetical protein